MLPAVPPAARSVGGAIATGELALAPAWIDLLLPSGAVRRVAPAPDAPNRDARLYRATLGGCGLTGIVLGAALPAIRACGDRARLVERRLDDLDAALEALGAVAGDGGAATVWLDLGAVRRDLGRGILRAAAPLAGWDRSEAGAPLAEARAGDVFAPPKARGPFDAFAWRRVPARGRVRHIPLADLLWGSAESTPRQRRALRFVCALPPDRAAEGAWVLLRHLSTARRAVASPALTRVERPGRGFLDLGHGHLGFACTIASHAGAEGLFAVLERTVLACGGQVALTSEPPPTRAGFRRMYPQAERFAAVRAEVDPDAALRSDLARRLGLDRT